MALNNLDLQIDAKMKQLGISRDFVAALAGISRTQLADACRGTGRLGAERGLKVWEILRELETLRNLAQPFPISFNNIATIQDLLTRLRDGDPSLRFGSREPAVTVPLFVGLLNDPDTSFEYVALESSNGVSLHHVRTWDSYASQPGLRSLSNLSTRDIWIDVNSSLPKRISYVSHPAQGAVAGTAIDVFLSNYQNSSGVFYPFTIQKSLNGTPWATITIQSVSLNTGLSDSSFPVQ